MASYHFAYKHGSRAKGHSAKAHADYIGREGRYGQGHYREQFVHAEHQNMPVWARERPGDFWQAADTYERANARLYTEMELALPRELDTHEQIELTRAFVQAHIGERHPVSWAIHTTHALDGGDNPHVHIMFSARTLDGMARDTEQFFKRANRQEPGRGGAIKDPIWEKKETLEGLRASWATTANQALARAGYEPTLDHRSLQAQGVDREPEPHLGREQTAMLRRGEMTEQGAKVIELRAYRERLGQVVRDIGETRGQLIDLQQARERRQAREAEQVPEDAEAPGHEPEPDALAPRLHERTEQQPGRHESPQVPPAGDEVLQGNRDALRTPERELQEAAERAPEDAESPGREPDLLAQQVETLTEQIKAHTRRPGETAEARERRWQEDLARMDARFTQMAEAILAKEREPSGARVVSPAREPGRASPDVPAPALPVQRPREPVLPKDLPTLDQMWQEAATRHFVEIEKRAVRIQSQAQRQLDRHRERMGANPGDKPEAPRGLFARWRQGGYQKRLATWQAYQQGLVRERQLQRRIGWAATYREKGLPPFGVYASKGERLAEEQLRAAQPELARARDQAREEQQRQQQERLRLEIERRRERERERGRNGPDLGMGL